jgi:hypothetical protein
MICQVARLMEGTWNLATMAFHSATEGRFKGVLEGVVGELVIGQVMDSVRRDTERYAYDGTSVGVEWEIIQSGNKGRF